MKKIFALESAGKTPERTLELVRSEVGRYLNREKRKPLALGMERVFECRIGPAENEAASVEVNQVPAAIDQIAARGAKTVFVQINAQMRARERANASGAGGIDG